MSLAGIVVLAATISPTPGWAAAEAANAPQPLRAHVVAIPTSLKGEQITSATLSGGGLLALGTAAGHLSILDQNLRAWRGGWEASAGSSKILRLAFSQDGTAIAGATSDALVVWRLDDRSVIKIPVKGRSPTAIALSSGGRFLAVTEFGISLFDVSSQRLVREFEQESADGGNGVYESVAFVPDATVVAAASLESIDAWDIKSGKRVQHWSCKCNVDGVALSVDAAMAVVGTADAHALLWELASGKVAKEKTMSAIEGDHTYGTAVDRAGALVAAGTASGWVVVWDTRSGVIIARAHPTSQPVIYVTSSDDGQLLLIEGQKAEYVIGSYDRWLMTLKP
jgi:WD40 repeat protein